MSEADWKYDYEPEVLAWLESRDDYFDFVCELDDLWGPKIEDLLDLLQFKFKLSREEALLRLQAWHDYIQYGMEFKCEKCGFQVDMSQSTSHYHCSCGAGYVLDGPNKWHRDDALGGTVRYEDGIKVITIR